MQSPYQRAGTFKESSEDDATHREHLRRMTEFYERTGGQYNKWHCNPSYESSHDFAVSELLRTMGEVQAKSLLDVGCGTGRATRAALDKGYEATGLDISSSLLDIAHRELGIPRERLIVGDATRLPFPADSFDFGCTLGTLHHSAQPVKIISELIRVCRRGIIVSDEANHFGGGVKALLLKVGLFKPVYWMLFRRPPRTQRRSVDSEDDGPAFAFSMEEVIPTLRGHFKRFRCLTFYRFGKWQIHAYRLPRLFARQAVVVVTDKR
jgi:ubiquinone/menaquinone biosynthesis C-methylase UbiE